MDEQQGNDEPQTSKRPHHSKKGKAWRIVSALIAGVVVLYGLFMGYAYTITPANVRYPAFQHLHFRLQILVDGKAVNFASAAFQQETVHDVCSANLTVQPFHFHDNLDQFVHDHWNKMTGGELLKYYGWNYIGGAPGSLGYRFDNFPKVTSVPIHGNTLPTVPQGDNMYVYVGDENGFKAKQFTDFVHQDFETFFGKRSNLPSGTSTGFLQSLFPKAYAASATTSAPDSEQLKQLNNLIGNAVIFVQKSPPTTAQIKARFDQLVPLPQSTCAG